MFLRTRTARVCLKIFTKKKKYIYTVDVRFEFCKSTLRIDGTQKKKLFFTMEKMLSKGNKQKKNILLFFYLFILIKNNRRDESHAPL